MPHVLLLAALVGMGTPVAVGQLGPGQALQFFPAQFAAHYGATGLPAGGVPRTMEMWLAFNSCGSTWGSIPGGFGNTTPNGSFQIDVCMPGDGFGPGDRFWLMTWGAFPSEYWDTGVVHSPYADSTWHHLAVTYDTGDVALFLDGEEVASTTGLPLNTDPFKILLGEEIDQGPSANLNHWFFGRLDEFRIWDRALAVQEIREGMHRRLATEGPEAASGLVGYFRFDADSSFAIDATANGNDLGFGSVFEVPDPNDPSRIPSTVPLGDGQSASGSISTDGTLFLADADVDATFDGVTGPMDVVATHILAEARGVAAADSLPDGAVSASSYWEFRRYGTGMFESVDLALRPDEVFFAPSDEDAPERIVLLHRPFNSDSGWTLVETATAIDAASQEAQFDGLTDEGQYLIARLDPLPVPVEFGDAFPERYALAPNYPNPFRSTTAIRYALPHASDVRLAVFDVLGRRVAVLVDGPRRAGWHTTRFEGAGLASGTYLVCFEAGGTIRARSIHVIR